MTFKNLSLGILLATSALSVETAQAQSQIYPEHFDLSEVRLLDSPFLNAMRDMSERYSAIVLHGNAIAVTLNQEVKGSK